MTVSESDYYRSRCAAERLLASSAAHPEARRRHAELAERYAELAWCEGSAASETIVTDPETRMAIAGNA